MSLGSFWYLWPWTSQTPNPELTVKRFGFGVWADIAEEIWVPSLDRQTSTFASFLTGGEARAMAVETGKSGKGPATEATAARKQYGRPKLTQFPVVRNSRADFIFSFVGLERI